MVINIKTGARYDVYIGRAGRGQDGYLGNPFGLENGRDECINKYRIYFLGRIETDAEFKKRILELRGKILGCFCKPLACHGDIIEEWLNNNQEVS
jgi:hypothetical protein